MYSMNNSSEVYRIHNIYWLILLQGIKLNTSFNAVFT